MPAQKRLPENVTQNRYIKVDAEKSDKLAVSGAGPLRDPVQEPVTIILSACRIVIWAEIRVTVLCQHLASVFILNRT